MIDSNRMMLSSTNSLYFSILNLILSIRGCQMDDLDEKPNWKELFENSFYGASLRERNFKAMIGFPVFIVETLWLTYGSECEVGKRKCLPNQFLWLLSYLRTSMNWTTLSLCWRVKESTFRACVKGLIDQLDLLVDEVRETFFSHFDRQYL